MELLGIDIGGSGIKGAIVDIEKGEFVGERHRIPTPQPSKPDAVADVVAEIAKHFDWTGAIGCTFPAIMKEGVAHSASNVDKKWIGTDAQALISEKTGSPVIVLNDADAAGVAEIRIGAGRDRRGTVMLLTLGTGIGSALFIDGQLVPNTELGHLKIRGKIAEHRASDRIRQEKDLSWKHWAKRLNEYLSYVEFLFSPDLFIIGGGVSKKHEKYFPYLKLKTEIVPAQLRNHAGIIGAAMAATALVE
ncbi:MAG: polyphosphate--glucose phosphotransferase [Aggregatilineales bacterium]